jgi:hypothetical protein
MTACATAPLPGRCPAGRHLRALCDDPAAATGGHVHNPLLDSNEYYDTLERDLLTIRLAPRADDPQHFMKRTRAVQPEIEWTA